MSNHGLVKYGRTTLNIRELVGLLFRHKRLITMTFLWVAASTVVTTLLLPSEYESGLKILVKNASSDVPITPESTISAVGSPFGKNISGCLAN